MSVWGNNRRTGGIGRARYWRPLGDLVKTPMEDDAREALRRRSDAYGQERAVNQLQGLDIPTLHPYGDELQYHLDFINIVEDIPDIRRYGNFYVLDKYIFYRKQIRFRSAQQRVRANRGEVNKWTGEFSTTPKGAAKEIRPLARDTGRVIVASVAMYTKTGRLIHNTAEQHQDVVDGEIYGHAYAWKVTYDEGNYEMTVLDGCMHPRNLPVDRLFANEFERDMEPELSGPTGADCYFGSESCIALSYLKCLQVLFGDA